jgi:hypothetical protein
LGVVDTFRVYEPEFRVVVKEVETPIVVHELAGMLMVLAELRVETRVMAVMVARTELVISKLIVFEPATGVTEEVMLAVGVRLLDME